MSWTRDRIEALGAVTDVRTVAQILGVDDETVYAAIRRGEWDTTRVLRVGRVIRIPTRDIVAALYEPTTAAECGCSNMQLLRGA